MALILFIPLYATVPSSGDIVLGGGEYVVALHGARLTKRSTSHQENLTEADGLGVPWLV